MHLFVLKNSFRSQDSTLTYSTFVAIPALYFITYLTFIKLIKTGIQKGLHMGYVDISLAQINKQIDFLWKLKLEIVKILSKYFRE